MHVYDDLLQALSDIDRIILLQVQDERLAQEALESCSKQLGHSWTTWDLGSTTAANDPFDSLHQQIDKNETDWILSFDLADHISDPVFVLGFLAWAGHTPVLATARRTVPHRPVLARGEQLYVTHDPRLDALLDRLDLRADCAGAR